MMLKEQQYQLAKLATFCPEIKLGTKSFQAYGSIEEDGLARKCMYDIDEYLLMKQKLRKY